MAQPRNILYVIGEFASSLSCKRILEEQGYIVACVTDAALVDEISQQRQVDLVLIEVAALRGLEAIASRVRRTNPRIPIVLLASQDLNLKSSCAWADGFANNSNYQAVVETVKKALAV